VFWGKLFHLVVVRHIKHKCHSIRASSFQKAGSKLDVIHRRLKKQPNVQHLILYHPEVVSVSTLEESIRHSDRSLTKALGKAFFDYGQLSKLILEMPIRSWNSKFSVNTSPFRLIAHRMSLPGSATIFHFWVISTDYKNYALVWSCDALCDEFKRGSSFIPLHLPFIHIIQTS